MPKLWEMLDQVYFLIGNNRNKEAQRVLDQILSADPQNMEAWDAYIHICETQNDLEDLRKQIINIWNSGVWERDYLLATQRFVLQHLEKKMDSL
jgi:hypothetical protein